MPRGGSASRWSVVTSHSPPPPPLDTTALAPRHHLHSHPLPALCPQVSVASDEPEDEDAEECHPEDYESWTMKQIRKELKERGVDTAQECRGCMEKSQFIEVLCKHM